MVKFPSAKCDVCPLKLKRCVGPEFHEGSQLMVIAEGPGVEEMIGRRPLIGPSGKLLRGELARVGIVDGTYDLSNATLSVASDEQEVVAAKACNERLWLEINTRKPRVILATGAWAFSALVGFDYKFKITRESGSIWEVDTEYGTVKVVPSVHPAYVLRQPRNLELFRAALARISVLLGEVAQNELTGFSSAVVSNELEFLSAEKSLLEMSEVTVDVETTGLSIVEDEITWLGVGNERSVFLFKFPISDNWKSRLGAIFVSKGVIGHNVKFDVAMLAKAGVYAHVRSDTMLEWFLLNEEADTYALKPLVCRTFGIEDWSGDFDRYLKGGKNTAPDEVIIPYLGKDVAYTASLHLVQTKLIPENMDRWLRPLMAGATEMFADIERKGIPIDPKALALFLLEYNRRVSFTREKLTAFSGKNPNSPVQLTPFIFDRLLPSKVTRGLPRGTTEANVLILIERAVAAGELEAADFLESLLEYRGDAKLLSTYAESVYHGLDREMRIHPNFHLNRQRTARVSITDPSLGNFPKHDSDAKLIRGIFASPGKGIFEADQSQFELRFWAALVGDGYMTEVFASGGDIHMEAVSLLGWGSKFAAAGDDERGAIRRTAKTVVFGLLYRMQAATLAWRLGVPIDEAEDMVHSLRGAWPKIETYWWGIKESLEEKDYVESVFGQRRRFPFRVGRHEFNQAVNFPIQNPCSHINLYVMVELWRRGIEVFWPVHDSIVGATSDPLTTKAICDTIEQISNSLLQELLPGTTVPLVIDGGFGKNWLEAGKIEGKV